MDKQGDSAGRVAEENASEHEREIEAMVHEAHRRPAYAVRAPAILRHRTFLFESRSTIKEHVTRLLESLPRCEETVNGIENLLDSMVRHVVTADGALAGALGGKPSVPLKPPSGFAVASCT